LYDWVVDNLPRGEAPAIPPESRPRQYEFARRNFEYTIVSKRKLLQLVREGHVSGWDDPRMPTLAGLRRRGYTPEAVRTFCEMIGIGKAENRADISVLEYAIRDDLNRRAPRVLCVLRPLKVVLTNYPEGQTEALDAPLFPHDVPKEGSRAIPFSRTLYIDRDDFMEDPPSGFFRLSPGAEVRLRYAYVIRCDEVIRNEAGDVEELRCSYYPETRGGKAPEGRTIPGTIHWVSADHALACTVRLYDRLFSVPDPESGDEDFKAHLNPDSLVVLDSALIEPSVADHPAGSHYQFERVGFFMSDPVESRPGGLVFNRTVTLRDTWARQAGGKRGQPQPGSKSKLKAVPTSTSASASASASAVAAEPPRSPRLEAARRRFEADLGIGAEEAEILSRDPATVGLVDAALAAGDAPAGSVANWIIHELPRVLGGRTLANLPFGGAALAELVALVEGGTVSSSAGREVLAEMARSGAAPSDIVASRGLEQVSDPGQLEEVVDRVLAANPGKVQELRDGKTGLLGFFIGQVMKETRGTANPGLTKELVERRVAGDRG
jgi:glutaminyl-tRNA synthetase